MLQSQSLYIKHWIQGRIQDFNWGGGGAQKIMRAHITSPFRQGSSSCLRGLEALGVFDTLSCYLSLILRILIQNGETETHSRSNFRGRACCAPSKSATGIKSHRGGSSIFNWGGGTKDEREARSPVYTVVVQALEALSRVFYAVLCYLSILIQNGIKKHSVDLFFLGGGGGWGYCAPSGSTTVSVLIHLMNHTTIHYTEIIVNWWR